MTTPPAHPRLAIVTGADSGMGKVTAELLATEGFDVGITFHTDEAGARETQREVEQRGQRCFVARHDAASPNATDTVEELVGRLGGVGVLVNNAGTGHSSPVLDLDLATWGGHGLAPRLTRGPQPPRPATGRDDRARGLPCARIGPWGTARTTSS